MGIHGDEEGALVMVPKGDQTPRQAVNGLEVGRPRAPEGSGIPQGAVSIDGPDPAPALPVGHHGVDGRRGSKSSTAGPRLDRLAHCSARPRADESGGTAPSTIRQPLGSAADQGE
ncbi:MAG: hypothetical protein WBG41_12825 [Acidimicrobiales bacterium]